MAGIIEKIYNRIIVSLQWRLGLKEYSLQLDRIENKIDFLLNHAFPSGSDSDIIQTHEQYPVVFISDRNYLEPTQVALSSLLRHSGASVSEVYLIFSEELSLAEKQSFSTRFPKLKIIQAEPIQTDLQLETHVTNAALLKFDLPDLLPDCQKILYLDSDLIIRHDLSDLFSVDIDNFYVAAVKDCRAIVDNVRQGYTMDSEYFNSGVMFLNLEKMRNDHISKKLREFRLANVNLHFVDQDVFNQVFREHVKLISPKFNMMFSNLKACFLPIQELADIYNLPKNTMIEAMNYPLIFHYGWPKPWKSSQTFGYEFWVEEKSFLSHQ